MPRSAAHAWRRTGAAGRASPSISEDDDGCLDDAARLVAAIKTTCTDGTELTTYDDRFRAVLGAEAKDSGATGTPADPGYAASLAACQT